MLNKYRYNNKVRYHFREKKHLILSGLEGDTKHIINKKFKHWRGKVAFKHSNVNHILYNIACKRFTNLYKKTRDLTREKYWFGGFGQSVFIWKKKPFETELGNRKKLLDGVMTSMFRNDTISTIKNSLYHLYDTHYSPNQILEILSFSWLFDYTESLHKYDADERALASSIKQLYKGFLQKGLKFKCEKRLLALLASLKLNLNKGGLDILYFFSIKLRPWVGFRRQRLGRRRAKKQDVRYIYKVFGHNLRWRTLLFRRLCLNSPFYKKKAKRPSVAEVTKALMQSIFNKGPIIKGLIAYYKLIKKRTPYAERKKKKNKNRASESKKFKFK